MIYGHGTVEKRFFPLEKSLTHRARGATLKVCVCVCVWGGGGGGLTQPGFNTFLSTIDDLNRTHLHEKLAINIYYPTNSFAAPMILVINNGWSRAKQELITYVVVTICTCF